MSRFIPHTKAEIKEMCEVVGVAQVEDLFRHIPEQYRLKKDLDIGAPLSEAKLLKNLKALSRENETVDLNDSFLGAGTYHHYIPVAVQSLAGRGEFLTAYTPYQAELSQGTLQAIFEFQTMVASLLGMEVANASQYDGATSLAEAILMALRVTRKKKVLLSRAIHPDYLDVIRTYTQHIDCELDLIDFDPKTGRTDFVQFQAQVSEDHAAICLQSPNFFGVIEDLQQFATLAKEKKVLLVTGFTEAIAYGLLEAPGNLGADIVAGEGASFGNFINFGGPHLGLFSSNLKNVRQMPGRLVGESVDSEGKRAFVLTLNTREQHIRREKATSNICTNQGLCALQASIYLSLIGPQGLKELALKNYRHAHYLKEKISSLPRVQLVFDGPFFNEFVLRFDKGVDEVLSALQKEKIFGGVALKRWNLGLDDAVLVCATDMNSKRSIDRYYEILKGILE